MTPRISLATTAKARALRRGMTDAERKLWRVLRHNQLNGQRFRRQHPVGKYITDFACLEQKIVIELDGGQHQEQLAYDGQRTNYLRTNGWIVLRFWNNEVLNNLAGVLDVIAGTMSDSPPSQPSP